MGIALQFNIYPVGYLKPRVFSQVLNTIYKLSGNAFLYKLGGEGDLAIQPHREVTGVERLRRAREIGELFDIPPLEEIARRALADAGIPMKDLVPAVAVGKVNDQVVLDLNKEEDNYGQADLPIAIIPRTGEVLLLQMDGHLTQEEFDKALDMGVKACAEIYELQKDALRRRYAIVNGDNEDEAKDEEQEMPEEA